MRRIKSWRGPSAATLYPINEFGIVWSPNGTTILRFFCTSVANNNDRRFEQRLDGPSSIGQSMKTTARVALRGCLRRCPGLDKHRAPCEEPCQHEARNAKFLKSLTITLLPDDGAATIGNTI